MTLIECFYTYIESTRKEATSEIKARYKKIRRLIKKVDKLIKVPIVPVYTFDVPDKMILLISSTGYYDPNNHIIYISDFLSINSFEFYYTLLHECLHSVHQLSRKHNYELLVDYEEGLNELFTYWLLIRGHFFPGGVDDEGYSIDYVALMRKSSYYPSMKKLFKLIENANVDLEDVFYNYCINNYEYLSKIIPEKYFESLNEDTP